MAGEERFGGGALFGEPVAEVGSEAVAIGEGGGQLGQVLGEGAVVVGRQRGVAAGQGLAVAHGWGVR